MAEGASSEGLRRYYDEVLGKSDPLRGVAVGAKAANYTGKLMGWMRLPEAARTETSSELSELREAAQGGNVIARQTLDRTRELLEERRVNISGLPDLNWQQKPT